MHFPFGNQVSWSSSFTLIAAQVDLLVTVCIDGVRLLPEIFGIRRAKIIQPVLTWIYASRVVDFLAPKLVLDPGSGLPSSTCGMGGHVRLLDQWCNPDNSLRPQQFRARFAS
jgi:hypothetical protein